MTEEEVRALIQAGEGETLEFKRSLAELEKALRTMAAFATQRSGIVLFGVTPEGEPCGVDLGKNTLENLANDIKRSIAPPLIPSIQVVRVEGRELVVVQVPRTGRVHLCGRDFYVRVGRTTQSALLEEYARELNRREAVAPGDDLDMLSRQHREEFQKIIAGPDPNAGRVELRIRLTPLRGGVTAIRSERMRRTLRGLAREHLWSGATQGDAGSDSLLFRSTLGSNLWITRTGTADYHRLFPDPPGAETLAPIMFPMIFEDLEKMLRFAEASYPGAFQYRGLLWVGISIVNIFDRPVYLPPPNIPDCRETETRSHWIGDELPYEIGTDPIKTTRQLLEVFLLDMGCEGVEEYLSQWGRNRERPKGQG